MTKALIIALALASITATAQTASTATEVAPAPTTAQEQATAAPTKKVSKKRMKKAKPTAEQTAKQVDDLATSSSTKIPKAPTATNVEPVSPVLGTPAGTTEAKVDAGAGPAKNWALKAQVYSTTDYLDTQDVQTLTSLGGSYKLIPKLTVKATETFETLTNGRDTSAETRELTRSSNFRTAFSDVGLSSSLPGMLGSDEMPISFNWKFLSGTADYITTGKYAKINAVYDFNWSVPFTINPKWSTSIDSQIRLYDKKEGLDRDGQRTSVSGTVTYTINDFVSVYQSGGTLFSTKDSNEVRLNVQRISLETGVTITPVKNLNVSFNINQDKAIYASPTSKAEVSSFTLYKPNEAASGPDATFDSVAMEALVTYAY